MPVNSVIGFVDENNHRIGIKKQQVFTTETLLFSNPNFDDTFCPAMLIAQVQAEKSAKSKVEMIKKLTRPLMKK